MVKPATAQCFAARLSRTVPGAPWLLVIAGYILGASKRARFSDVALPGDVLQSTARRPDALIANCTLSEPRHTSAEWRSETLALLGESVAQKMDDWTAPGKWLCEGQDTWHIGNGAISKQALCKAFQDEENATLSVLRALGFLLTWLTLQVLGKPLRALATLAPACCRWIGFVADEVAGISSVEACSLVLAVAVCVALRPALLDGRSDQTVVNASVPGNLPTDKTAVCETVQGEFAVTIDAGPNDRVGLMFVVGGPNLRVVKIEPGALMDQWNKKNPMRAVRAGDLIHSVNGVRVRREPATGQFQSKPLIEALKSGGTIDMVLSHVF